jgi:hypothetical protein
MATSDQSYRATEEVTVQPRDREGRDEMNLSEYPIALLADRVPKGVKTLVYKDRDETLTVTGSDLLGLPTALDIDVIIALLCLTKRANDFTEHTVNFTRYELIEILRWSHQGYSYDRVSQSLTRWVGVTLIYKRSWWDNKTKHKGNASFHILDAANVVERCTGVRRSGQQELPLSSIRWGEEFFKSCQANNLKKLDLEVYFSLESSISKQLYRFLDKRFYKKPEWTFDLRTLACEHIGLSRNYPSWKIKQKLEPAIDELARVGFLRPMGPKERYTGVARGEWSITFARHSARAQPAEEAAPEEPEATPLVAELVRRGVTRSTAEELVRRYPPSRISAQAEYLDFKLECRKEKRISDPPAYLVRAIEKDYAAPEGFESKAVRLEREEAKREKQRRESEAERRDKAERAREDTIRARVSDYWDGLSREEQDRLDAEALERGDAVEVASYRRQKARRSPLANACLKIIRDAHIRRMLDTTDRGGRLR